MKHETDRTSRGAGTSLEDYTLLDALRGRRSRRFGMGMKISSGPFAYESKHEQLTEEEEGALAFVILASRRPDESRDIILTSAITKAIAGVVILYWVFVTGIELPSPWLLPAAVVVQILFAAGEAAYLLPARTNRARGGAA